MENRFEKKILDAVAVQLISIIDCENYCIACDLKDEKVWKKFDLPESVQDEDDWEEIYKILAKECPPNIVKFIFLNIYDISIQNDFQQLLEVEKHGKKFGYINFNWTTIWFSCLHII